MNPRNSEHGLFFQVSKIIFTIGLALITSTLFIVIGVALLSIVTHSFEITLYLNLLLTIQDTGIVITLIGGAGLIVVSLHERFSKKQLES